MALVVFLFILPESFVFVGGTHYDPLAESCLACAHARARVREKIWCNWCNGVTSILKALCRNGFGGYTAVTPARFQV